MQITIDRFEGTLAVVEGPDGAFATIERALLPPEAREGDVLSCGEDGAWQMDPAETEARRARIRRKLEALWDDG